MKFYQGSRAPLAAQVNLIVLLLILSSAAQKRKPAANDGNSAGASLNELRSEVHELKDLVQQVVVGQDQLFVSPNSPTSSASLIVPALSYVGNWWPWTPQIFRGDAAKVVRQSQPKPSTKTNMAKTTNHRRPTILRTRSRRAPQLECKSLVDKEAQ